MPGKNSFLTTLKNRKETEMKEQKHANIPIFIPHLGCPNNCVFCNQRSISGHLDFDRKTVTEEIETALSPFSVARLPESTAI